MDAQNANEAAPPKPSASSASSRLPDSDRQKTSSSSAVAKSPTLSRAAPPSSKDAKPSVSSSKSPLAPASNETSKPSGSKSTAALPRDPKEPKDSKETKSSAIAPSREKQQDDDSVTDGSSEAETIVLSKDGSPAKPRNRKVIKHEDKSNGASSSSIAAASADSVPPSRRHHADKKDAQSDRGNRSAIDFLDGPAPQVKKKKLHDKLQPSSNLPHARGKNPSSSLSSVPGSPPRSRNASSHLQSGSDTDHVHRSKSPRRALSTASKDRLRPPEKLVPYKRKATKYDSDDDAETHNKVRRQRLANANASANIDTRPSKDPSRSAHGNGNGGSASLTKSLAPRSSRDESLNRSESPPLRSHRRSLSTHTTSQSNGLAVKKKRVPAPLQTTDYHSDESSTSGSPRVRSAKLRNLAAPATAESSPAKIVAHKKHLDAHGQTYLARACARGEYDLAKKRLQERPEDLNVADFAGNTPLQIAALNGYGNIVKLLIDAGCNLDCVNYDKDTPLLDAVDNGHLEVVQLLLDAGVNPRKANVNGEEPLDRVDDSVDNADAIRTALVEAKKNGGGRRFTSEEHRHENDDLRFLQGLDESPRRSPAPGGSSNSRRTGTIRATKTSNHLLYMPMDDKTLRLAAGRGDEQNVIRILQVREAFDDPESMVAASRGGHDVVLQLLLALGRANPDPAPITNVPPEHATPILAAIGQENLKVVSLLLEQSNFDPTKRFNGETYYELARQRAGPNWREEEDILKKAYDSYKKHNGNKTKSPPQKIPESRRVSRAVEPSDEMPTSRALKRKLSSPSLERPKKTSSSIKATASSATAREEKDSGKQKRTDSSIAHAERHTSPKRASSSTILAKTKPRDDRSSVTSTLDRDTPPPSKQVSKSRKTDSDSVAMSSEGETKPRRKKLVSGRELKDVKVREKEKEREKQRRSSLASTNTATPSKDSASPRESRSEDAPTEKARVDKHRERDRDRARQLKKEDSKDSSGATGESAGKRHRLSETPPNATSSDKDGSEAPVKRRRLESDNAPVKDKEKKSSKIGAASDDVPSKSLPSISVSSKAVARRREGSTDDRRSSLSASAVLKAKKREASSDRARKESSKSSVAPIEKSIHVKSEDIDVEMADVSDARPSNGPSSAAEAKAQREKDDEKKKKAEAEAKKKEEELQRRRKEEDKKKELEEKEKEKKKKDEEKRKREEEEAERLKEEEEKKKKEAEEKKRKELEEKKKKEEEEKLKRKKQQEEEERQRQRKEAERKRKEEEEQKKREEAELKRVEEERTRRLEEEQRKQREEEERRQKEQLAREAAAREAQRKREEEERLRREQEHQERERIRVEKEAEERRLQLEERERHRVASLPPLLRWLSVHPNPKQTELATLFKVMQGVRYDCINTNANGTAEGREQWLINTQVALLFGDKDLELSRFPSWDHLPVSQVAKQIIWNLESDRYALTDPLLFDLGNQLPEFYGAQGPRALGSMGLSKIRNDASDKFFATDMFFVKVSDVMATIPSLPHLHDVRMAMEYRELPEHESQLLTLALNPKWKSDPDADKNLGFAPGTKYFVNGTQIGENRAGLAKDSKTPPRAVRVPRRGFVSVPIDDPEFELICKEQSIDPFSFPAYNKYKSKLQNGVPKVNGIHPMTNGTGVPLPNGQAPRPTVNGIHSTRGI
ncbi:ankyrin repeat protein [Ophiostoma piceae UAMH 11346]|uniref:Ankyrin repeat protein n=1 Tax=Ophiostoma piceae (strain UAMH 11346) TaxID=1262450 RepID=S3D1Z3_OPHP1|nr:ankyrin repeat protein [Ophiostoma piceae UAMH 11346]